MLITVTLLIRSPLSQTILARVATVYLSKKLNSEISIDRLEVHSFNKLKLKNLFVIDIKRDTLFYTQDFTLEINQISLSTKTLNINKIYLFDADIRLKKYKGEDHTNLSFIVDYFSDEDSPKKDSEGLDPGSNMANKWKVKLNDLYVSNSSFRFKNENKERRHDGVSFRDIFVYDLNADLQDIMFAGDTLDLSIQHISLKESSGFIVDSLSCKFKISPQILQATDLLLLTSDNDLDLDLSFSYNNFKDFNDFINQIHIQSKIRPSIINLSEVGYFAPVMFNMDNRMKISMDIKGNVNNFKAKSLKFAYNSSTQFRGDVHMNGLPDIRETFTNLKIRSFSSTVNDAREFRLPTEEVFIDLPEILTPLGNINIKGNFTGFYNDFVSFGDFNSDIGHINTDILLRVNNKDDIEYHGKIAATDFDAGKFFSIPHILGELDLVSDIKGSGISFETMNIQMDGTVDSLEFYDNIYNEVIISGNLIEQNFNGLVNVRDDNVNFDFKGLIDYSSNIPEYKFVADINDAYLHRINLIDRDTSSLLSTHLDINLIGDDPDNMQGIIMIDSTVYSEFGQEFNMDKFTLGVTRESSDYSFISIYSDIFDMSVEGKLMLRTLPKYLTNLFNQYFDNIFPEVDQSELAFDQDFNFEIELKNTAPITSIFLPELNVTPGTIILGDYNSRINNLSIHGSAPQINFFDQVISNWQLEFKVRDNEIYLNTGSDQLFFSDTLNINNLNLICKAKNNGINFDINWENNEHSNNNYGDLNGLLSIYGRTNMELKLSHGKIMINDSLWLVNQMNQLFFDSTQIVFKDIGFNSYNQSLTIDGIVSNNPLDTLKVSFGNFNMSNIDLLLKEIKIDIDGLIDGEMKITNYYKSPSFLSDLKIYDLHMNKEKLGDARIKSIWNPENKAFDILGEIIYTGNIGQNKTLEIVGTYYPDALTNFDIDISLNNYKLNTLEPFLSSFSSNIDGIATGKFKLGGTKKSPNLTGEISLKRTQLLVDYTQVTYYFADKIYLNENRIYCNDIAVYDSLNNKAIFTGNVYHNYLKDFEFDLNFDIDNVAGLNTTRKHNSSFYGKALASGNLKIYGPLDDLSMDIAARSDRGTNIKIPVSYDTEVAENDYIVFIDHEQDTLPQEEEYDVDLKGMSMKLDLNITNDADIQMFLPYQMGNIKMRGQGDIVMDYTSEGDFYIDGEYKINRGSLFLTLQSIINRDFEIRRGSKVSWTGDPYDAKINLKAVYKVKTTLGEYAPEADSAKRIAVDCVIGLSNRLLDPEITFSIEFPDLSDNNKQYVYSRLDTNDQAQMSQQMISLLVLNSFSYSSGSSGNVSFNTFSLLTNQLNNWLSQISNDFDVGINYRPGDEISSQEVELALSTQLFDDRVIVDGNVGVKGSETAQKTNDLVGEVMVEVKITPDGRFRARAFNKSNNDYLYKNFAPYTQGVGVFYTKEFNKFFGNRKEDKKKKDKQDQTLLENYNKPK